MPEVTIRPTTRRDARWLLRAGLSRELVGVQYHWAEAPLQVVIAPLRAWGRPAGPSYLIERDGERVGYVGRNPLSGNLEYFVVAGARGGVGGPALDAFLRSWLVSDDRPRAFFVSRKNERSLSTLLGALGRAGCREGDDYEVREGRFGRRVRVTPRPRQPGSSSTR